MSGTADEVIPTDADLEELRRVAAGCTGCVLFASATQTVFGEGGPRAELMLVGEQPGDHEDLQGRPFVGPAGRLLDESLEAAGIDRGLVYVTNVVKHFKWEPRGKRRIHKKPNLTEIRACRPWLDAELEVVSPQAVVCLGATAAQALLGKSFRVSEQRGEIITDSGLAPIVSATLHPSAVLRLRDEADRASAKAQLTQDLARVTAAMKSKKG